MRIDSTLLLTLANIFDNLSVGWFGAAFILPAFSEKVNQVNVGLLTVDILFGTLCFIIAYYLRKLGDKL